MKFKPNEVYKVELLGTELNLLCRHYDKGIKDTEKSDSEMVQMIRKEMIERRTELERYADRRCWNKGTGRRKSPAPEPPPALPMDGNPVETRELANTSTI